MKLALLLSALVLLPTARAHAKCEVTVDGAVKTSGVSKGGIMELGTDYWYKPDELDKAVEQMVRLTNKKEDADAKVKQQLASDPKIYTVIFNCMTDDITINLLPGTGSKYKDVPFAAKKYKVTKPPAKVGDFHALVRVAKTNYKVDAGELAITAFDGKRFAGTFELKAKPMSGKGDAITIKAKFDYPCHMPTQFCKEGR